MNGLSMASLPWQPQRAFVIGVGERARYSKKWTKSSCKLYAIFVRS
jgi:hypothetical protein